MVDVWALINGSKDFISKVDDVVRSLVKIDWAPSNFRYQPLLKKILVTRLVTKPSCGLMVNGGGAADVMKSFPFAKLKATSYLPSFSLPI